MTTPLVSTSFLFRFAAPLLRLDGAWWPKVENLDERYRLASLAELDELPVYAELRAAWNDSGLMFSVKVDGKKQPPWCRDNRIEDSDSLHLFIDTRDTHNIHRASRFCHHLAFLPTGGGHRLDQPVGEQLLINRARENPKPIRPGVLRVASTKRVGGYTMDCFVPAAALTGFDPAEHPKLGFQYAVVDRELGQQTFSCGSEFPYREDPSLWATLEMTS